MKTKSSATISRDQLTGPKVRYILVMLLIACTCSSSFEAQAQPPHMHHAEGIVTSINFEAHTLLFKSSAEKKPFVLHWNGKTEFQKDGRLTDPKQLGSGNHARIDYSVPFFSKPELKRITW